MLNVKKVKIRSTGNGYGAIRTSKDLKQVKTYSKVMRRLAPKVNLIIINIITQSNWQEMLLSSTYAGRFQSEMIMGT
jgi:hypothetical protein